MKPDAVVLVSDVPFPVVCFRLHWRPHRRGERRAHPQMSQTMYGDTAEHSLEAHWKMEPSYTKPQRPHWNVPDVAIAWPRGQRNWPLLTVQRATIRSTTFNTTFLARYSSQNNPSDNEKRNQNKPLRTLQIPLMTTPTCCVLIQGVRGAWAVKTIH